MRLVRLQVTAQKLSNALVQIVVVALLSLVGRRVLLLRVARAARPSARATEGVALRTLQGGERGRRRSALERRLAVAHREARGLLLKRRKTALALLLQARGVLLERRENLLRVNNAEVD